jgi:cytidyltransferase-like protein
MKVVAIYPGRFHPFHKGHASSFKQLAEKFGLDNTYLAISAKQEQPKSPFSAQDRAKMAVSLGIPSKNIIAVRNPYAAQEYIDQLNLDPEQTALIFGVSKKDMEGDPALGIPPDPRFGFKPKKDGSLSYLQPFNKNKVDPMTQHGYVMSTEVAEFPIAGKSMRDASAIRSAYAGADEKTKMRILTDLYGDAAEKMKQVFDNNLQVTESIRRLITMIKPMLSEASFEQKQKFVNLLGEAKKRLDEGRENLPPENFTSDDINGLMRLRDLDQIKLQAFRMITNPNSSRPMKPNKVEWLKQRLTQLRDKQSVIKLLYDLLLSGEGNNVIGTRYSMEPNVYRKTFKESSENHLYTERQIEIIEDLGNGYFLGDDSYDDDDGFVKAGYSVYKQVGDDSFKLVGSVSMSPYSNPPGHIENEIKKLISSDQNISESSDYLEEK